MSTLVDTLGTAGAEDAEEHARTEPGLPPAESETTAPDGEAALAARLARALGPASQGSNDTDPTFLDAIDRTLPDELRIPAIVITQIGPS